MKCVGYTDIGTKRKNNQDSFIIDSNEQYAFAVVCDGMGGAKGGAVASALAADAFSNQIHAFISKKIALPTSGDLRRAMVNALDAANKTVFEMSETDDELEGMGTTLVSFLDFKGGKTVVTNIGDSCLYTFTKGRLCKITKDHSFVQFLIDTGSLAPEEAKTHPKRNIILRAVGINENAEGDIFFAKDYDMLMLCTDGLMTVLTEEEIAQILSSSVNIKTKCKRLINLANSKGADDNITVVLYG